MMQRLQTFELFLCILAATVGVAGQQSNVTTCNTQYQWSINDKGQTPCLVAAFLESACGKSITVNSLPIASHYQGPTLQEQNQCLCSSVTYSMVSACAGCQGRNFQNWTAWSENCIGTTVGSFPVSPGVDVPNWALLNITINVNQTFDPLVAQASLSPNAQPNSQSPSSTVASSTTTLASAETSMTASSSSLPDSTTRDKKHTDAGAIAGGVVGGLVFLAVVVLVALWWYMRKKRNAVPEDSATFDNSALVSKADMTQVTSTTTSPGGPSPLPYSSLYGTSSMSTFPTSPITSAVYTTAPLGGSRRSTESISQSLAHFGPSGGHRRNLSQQLTGYSQAPTGYRGAAEV